jgi:hypothetical protein
MSKTANHFYSDLVGSSHITIIPNFSGYRDKETQEFTVTANYLNVLEHYINTDQQNQIDKRMGIFIPLTEISMVSKFISEIFF